MDNQNRYEEVPQEQGFFKKFLNFIANMFITLGHYLRNVAFDFVNSFRYNNMKLPALLVAAPGIFLGFFLGFHSKVIGPITYNMATYVSNGESGGCSYKIGFDYGGIVLFILMLLGILNIFGAVSMSGKKNLGSVIICTISTIAIVGLSALYLYALAAYNEGATTLTTVAGEKTDVYYIDMVDKFKPDKNWGWSISSIIISCVTSVTGCILGFIFYDRTYEKVDR